MRAAILFLLTAAALTASAEPAKVDHSMVVLDFTAQTPADAQRASAASALFTAQLQKHPGAKLVTSSDVKNVIGVDRQKALLGCNEDSCLAELGGALGTRYVVTGQVGTLGSKVLLSAALVDAHNGRSVQRFAQTLDSDDALPTACAQIADSTAEAAGLPAIEGPPGSDRGFNLDVKLGNALPTLTDAQNVSLHSFNLRLDMDLGYFVTAQTTLFLGASLDLAGASGGDSLQFIPVLFGAKYFFRPGMTWQPYLGGGLGLGFLAGKLTGAQSTSTSFTITGIGGVALLPWKHVGFNLELSANLSGANVSGAGLLLAYNTDLGVLFLF